MAKEDKKKKDKKKEEAEGSTEKKGGGINKILLMIIGLLLGIIIAGGAAMFFMFQAPSDEEIAKEIQKDEVPQEEVKPTDNEIGVIVELKPFIVNLEDPKARHFLKATISLEVKDDEAKSEVEKYLPRIRNDILLLLSSKTLEDVITIEGKVRLKDEIMARLNRILGAGKLKNVYFSQFVVQ